MKTQIIEHAQGSNAWHMHRAKHLNASDCAAVLGLSSYKTRSQLLKEKATGFIEEVDGATQYRFAKGHEFEATARPWAEEIIGTELYPVVLAGEFEGLNLSASLDGLDMLNSVSFEHKTGRADLLASLESGTIPPEYHPQMEMGLMLSGASKCLFMASSGNKEAMRFAWYTPNLELRAQIIAAWHQFKLDLENYVPPVVTVAPVAKAASALPVVFDMRVEGKLVSCNLEQYKPAALAYIAAINTELVTDQNFADADADAKFCRASADKLNLAIEQVLGQMGDINQALNTVREISAAFNGKGLALEKLVKAEKENRRTKILGDAVAALHAHLKGLQERTRNYMPTVPNQFQDVIKGLKSLDSMKDKLAGELARCKIEANAIADRISFNLALLDDNTEFGFLFPDAAQVVLKAADDFTALVNSRIAAHKAEAARKEEETRARIQAEEQAKAERAHAAKVEAERIEREQAEQAQSARIREEQAAFDEQERAEIARLAKLNTAVVVEAAPALTHAQVVQQMPATVRQAMAPAPTRSATPTMTLGEISTKLGFNVTSVFLASLGFEATTVKAAKLFHEEDFPSIGKAIIEHIEKVCELQTEAA